MGRRHRRLREAHEPAAQWRTARQEVDEAQELLAGGDVDGDTQAFLQETLEGARERLPAIEEELRLQMLERDPADDKDVIVEIRAGTGGDEAALFASDLLRMLTRYAERRGFKHQVLTTSPSDAGGVKDVTFEVTGDGAYSVFKWEAGVHRVQRVPQTETQGRIHTSTATVAVMPEAEEVDVVLDPKDLEIDTTRGWGPGGQSVNTTDSAVRVVHKPTGLMVVIQDERSQLQNKERALRILRARLLEIEREKREAELSAERKSQIGTGARSEKIRTYNFPQSRVTDHRVKHTSHNLEAVLFGDLEDFTNALQSDDNRQRLEQASAGAAS